MPEPIDPSLAQPGTGGAQVKPETVVSSEGQSKASAQNDVPANFVEITQIIEQPSPNEGAENEYDPPDDEETAAAEWPPADKSHSYWQKMEALQKEIDSLQEAEQKAYAQMCTAVRANQSSGDLERKWRRALEDLRAKEKFAAEEENRMREEAAIDQEEDEATDEDDLSVEEQSPPKPEYRFRFTVGGIPVKADAFTAMQDLVRIVFCDFVFTYNCTVEYTVE